MRTKQQSATGADIAKPGNPRHGIGLPGNGEGCVQGPCRCVDSGLVLAVMPSHCRGDRAVANCAPSTGAIQGISSTTESGPDSCTVGGSNFWVVFSTLENDKLKQIKPPSSGAVRFAFNNRV